MAELYKNLQLNHKYSLNLNLGVGRSDNRLAYRLFDNVIVGEKYVQLSEAYKTSLATQSSLDKIASLIESSLYWGKITNFEFDFIVTRTDVFYTLF